MGVYRKIDRVRGSLIGGAIGDALGYPVEFLSYKEILHHYGDKGITRLDTGFRRAENGKAFISDDTQMTLFTACGLLNAKRDDMEFLEAIRLAYIEWYYTQQRERNFRFRNCWIGDLSELNVRRAPGNTCLTALKECLSQGWANNRSKGCGGIMRIAPIPLYGLSEGGIKDVGTLNRMAVDAASITHKHPLGCIPAYIASHLIYRLASEKLPSRSLFEEYLHEAMRMAEEMYRNYNEDLDLLQRLVDRSIRLAKGGFPDHEAIWLIGEGWVAEETLAIAVYCVYRHFDDFEAALIASVNHTGDSDSTGSLTGNILGAAVGYDDIPLHFKDNLELHDVILHVADDLWRGYTTPFPDAVNHPTAEAEVVKRDSKSGGLIGFRKRVARLFGFRSVEEKLYEQLNTERYKEGEYRTEELGEGMAVVKKKTVNWFTPRYLLNHEKKCAYLFVVRMDDVDWTTLEKFPENVKRHAKGLSMYYPSSVYKFQNGVAEVVWQLQPEGRFWMDEDGYGMTDDDEICIYGFIDKKGGVIVKFRDIDNFWEREVMRRKAEEMINDFRSR